MNSNTTDATRTDPSRRCAATTCPKNVFDLEGLRKRCMGDLHLVQNVLKTFHERMPTELKTIETALQSRDTDEIARIAHRVRGTSASVSADGMARAAAAVEDAGRHGQLDELSNNVKHLRDEWETYLNYADELLSAAKNM